MTLIWLGLDFYMYFIFIYIYLFFNFCSAEYQTYGRGVEAEEYFTV